MIDLSLPLLILPDDDFGIGNEGNRKLNFNPRNNAFS